MTRLLKIQPYQDLIKLFCALPLLPVRFISRGFRLLMQETMDHGVRVYRRMRQFMAYVSRRWANHPVRKRWMCVFASEHRTNNTSGNDLY